MRGGGGSSQACPAKTPTPEMIEECATWRLTTKSAPEEMPLIVMPAGSMCSGGSANAGDGGGGPGLQQAGCGCGAFAQQCAVQQSADGRTGASGLAQRAEPSMMSESDIASRRLLHCQLVGGSSCDTVRCRYVGSTSSCCPPGPPPAIDSSQPAWESLRASVVGEPATAGPCGRVHRCNTRCTTSYRSINRLADPDFGYLTQPCHRTY